jgi:hypothetical protein
VVRHYAEDEEAIERALMLLLERPEAPSEQWRDAHREE